MAMSILLRSQTRSKVSGLLSNVTRFSSTVSSASGQGLKLLEQKSLVSFLPQAKFVAPTLQKNGIRNFSVTVPKQAAAGSDHSGLWTAERFLSAGLLLFLPGALLYPNQILDSLLAVSLVMHAHWGLEAIVTDYIRPVLFGNAVPKVAHLLLIVYSAVVLGGLLYFNFTDVGISNAVRSLWAIKGQ